VDDAVADGVRRHEVLDRLRFVTADEVKLEARRARVDDQDIHGRGFS
jgi:hypothetical protein